MSAARFERSFATPIATPRAHTAALGTGKVRRRLSRLMRGAGRASGAWVADLREGGRPRRLFTRRAGKRRKLASNTKVFTTSTALIRFGPEGRLETGAWATGPVLGGQLNGDLVLRGGGDPQLSKGGITTLAARVRAAGVTSVTGKVIYDESFLDGARGVPETGVSGGLGAALSGLMYPGGGKAAASDFVAALKARGVAVSAQVASGQLPKATSTKLAGTGSATIAELIADTNIPSDNFLAEVLAKDLGATFGTGGSTAAGMNVVKSFARGRGARLKAENGSGLSVRNRAAPASVGRLLVSMLREDPATRAAWTDSLAVAGVSGTLARRMRGTPAARTCRGKTGTLNGVSALSGYCTRSGHTVVFSFLMSKIGDSRAHSIQDRMAATVATFGR